MAEPVTSKQFPYGPDASEQGHLWVPAAEDPVPVVVLVHGGFWRRAFGADLMEPLATDLFERGYAVWNIEYGRVGEARGGWPHTLEHVASAVDYLTVLAEHFPLDLERVAVVGHSAGGHLALWTGSRNLLPDSAPGANPAVEPKLVVGQGGVSDLYAAAEDRIGNGAVVDFLGGTPDEVPERYEVAQPRQGSAAVVLINGKLDNIVQQRYSLRPGIEVTEVVIPGADHFDLIDPAHDAWAAVIDALIGPLTSAEPRPYR